MTEEQKNETFESATENVLALDSKLNHLLAKKEHFVKQVVINKEKQAIIEAGYRPVKVTMEYEQDERFWEIMLEELQFKHAMVNNTDDATIEEMDKTIAETSQYLTEAQDVLAKFQEELGV